MQLWLDFSKKMQKKKFTIVPSIDIITTSEERERFQNAAEHEKFNIIVNELYRSIEDTVEINRLGSCIIRQVIVDGKVWKTNYICEFYK